jgi:diacylglycerol kinase family enzyme
LPRLLLIANPASSQFTGGDHRTVARILSRSFEVEPAWPSSAEAARLIAAGAAQDGVDVVAAMGGDGIVHHVAQSLADTDVTLAVLPAGTTNVLARLLGLPKSAVPAARLVAGAHEVAAHDLLSIVSQDANGSQRRFAAFAAGWGLDAETVASAEAEPYRKYRFGGMHYARHAMSTAFGKVWGRPPNVRVTAGERTADAVTVLVQFLDVYTYFGRVPLRFHPTPPEPMHVLVIEGMGVGTVPSVITRLLRGRDLGGGKLQVWTGVRSLTMEADPPVMGQADGELIGAARRADLALLPGALRVIVPRTR